MNLKTESDSVFRVVAKIQNNRLINAREELGLSCPAAAAEIGVGYGSLLQYESLKSSPWSPKGEWKASARKISDWYGLGLDYLWPDVVKKVLTTKTIALLSEPPAPASLEDKIFKHKQLPEATQKVLETLDARERFVLETKYGINSEDGEEKTLEEVAVLLSKFDAKKKKKRVSEAKPVGRERIRQIEAKALRNLRHPSRSKHLKYFTEAWINYSPPTAQELEAKTKKEKEAEEKRREKHEKFRAAETIRIAKLMLVMSERQREARRIDSIMLFCVLCQAELLAQHYLKDGFEPDVARHWGLVYMLVFYPKVRRTHEGLWTWPIQQSLTWARLNEWGQRVAQERS